MPLCQLTPELSAWICQLAVALDVRPRHRLLELLTGVLFACCRRTVTAWFRPAGITSQFRRFYDLLPSVGRRARWLATRLLVGLLAPRLLGEQPYLLFAIDDTPTRRHGPQVEGAGIHHDPAPGPAGDAFLYGH